MAYMARPTKNNAEYFSHDADMRNDVKVKALRRRYGHTGYAVWCYLLETLTDADRFEVDYRALNQELLAADFEIQVEELREIVDYCCTLELLQLTEDRCYLYSEAHKRRLADVVALREKRSRAGKLGMAVRWGGNGNNKLLQVDNTVITPDSKGKESKSKETKGKEKKEKESKSSAAAYPCDDVVALWNDICGGSLPRVKALNDNRRQKIKCRLEEFSKDSGEWLARVRELFERVIASDFLRGGNKSGWTATFDWLFENGKNWVKVVEGNYDNDRSARGAQQQQRTQSGITLGVGEYIEPQTGRRTYGSGKATIPPTAPARPSERHSWDKATNSWILL